MQEKTLYVHIGTHKTATTSIQEFGKHNPSVFEENGCVYPIFPFAYPWKTDSRNGLFLGTIFRDEERVRHPEKEEEFFQTGIGIIHELFERYHTIVLSDEGLWINFIENYPFLLQRLKDDSDAFGYRLKLIIYLRRQDSFIESWWNQRIKQRYQFSESFPSYASRFAYLDYYELLMKFATVVGEENLIVRCFPNPEGVGILQDFLAQVGINFAGEDGKEEEPFENVQLYGNTVEIKRVINQLNNIDHKDNVMLRKSIGAASMTAKNIYSTSEFSEEERAEFMKQFEESNRLLTEHFAKERESFFSENYSGPEKRTSDNPYLLDDIIRSSAATDIALHHKIRKLEKEIEKLQRKVDHLRHPVQWLMKRGNDSGKAKE